MGKDKTKVSIIEDEGHSYGAILAEFDKKKLDICHNGLAHNKQTVVHMQIVIKVTVPFPSTIKFHAPIGIDCCIADAMRVVRIKDLKSFTFRSWVIRVVDYLKSLPGTILRIVFDDYRPTR